MLRLEPPFTVVTMMLMTVVMVVAVSSKVPSLLMTTSVFSFRILVQVI